MDNNENISRRKNIIIILLFLSVILLSIAYINFSGVLSLENLKHSSHWNVGIKNAKTISTNGNTTEISKVDFTNQILTYDVLFKNVGDSIKYEIEVENDGNLDAKINNIIITNNQKLNDVVLFNLENVCVGDTIKAGKKKKFYLSIIYNTETKDIPYKANSSIILEFSQKK